MSYGYYFTRKIKSIRNLILTFINFSRTETGNVTESIQYPERSRQLTCNSDPVHFHWSFKEKFVTYVRFRTWPSGSVQGCWLWVGQIRNTFLPSCFLSVVFLEQEESLSRKGSKCRQYDRHLQASERTIKNSTEALFDLLNDVNPLNFCTQTLLFDRRVRKLC